MVIIAANINMDNCEFRHNFGGLGGAISWQGGCFCYICLCIPDGKCYNNDI